MSPHPFTTLAAGAAGGNAASVGFLMAAAVTLYVASRAAENAVAGRPVLAFVLAAAVPTGAGAILAAAFGHGGAAMALVFGVAVACVTLVLGLGLNTRPDASAPAGVRDPDSRDLPSTAAAALLPAALAVLFAGFGGALGLTATGLLLGAGAAVALLAWPALTFARGQVQPVVVALVQLLLAALLAAAGAALAYAGSTQLGARMGRDLTAVAATVLVAPMIGLPLIGIATQLAARRRKDEIVAGAALAAAALLTLVLPLVAAAVILVRWRTAGTLEATLPLRLWRLDAVVVAIAGLLLLPVAARRWLPGPVEGLGLSALYVAYLVVSVVASR